MDGDVDLDAEPPPVRRSDTLSMTSAASFGMLNVYVESSVTEVGRSVPGARHATAAARRARRRHA